MTQLRKGTAERASLIHGGKPGKETERDSRRETENEADVAIREVREKAELQKAPGGKHATDFPTGKQQYYRRSFA